MKKTPADDQSTVRPRTVIIVVCILIGISRLATWLSSSPDGAPPPSAPSTARTADTPAGVSPPPIFLTTPTATSAASGAPRDELAEIPISAAVRAREHLRAALAARRADTASYLAFRRAVACGEPFFRDRRMAAEALFGAGPNDEIGGPLGRLDAAIAEGDAAVIARDGPAVDSALRLMEDLFTRTPEARARMTLVLPRAAYALGGVLAGSRPGTSTTMAGRIADAQGLLDAIERATAAYGKLVSPTEEYGPAATRASERMAALRKALDAAEKARELTDVATLVLWTGRLGADLRTMLGGWAWKPYAPRVSAASSGASEGEPLSVLTVPALRRLMAHTEGAEGERRAALGEALFFDRSLSKGGVRSCATCHVPEKGYADGKPRPDSLDPKTPTLRHVPSLLYAPLQASQFWDGRALTSEKQALLVIHSPAEMGDTSGAFPRPSFATVEDAASAIAAFEARSLVPADSPMDRFARGDEQALTAEDRAGFDVFTGKGRCSRCHAPPLFGGSLPTDFATPVYAAIGVPESPAGKALDPDRGRGAITGQALDMHAFKTPTVRNGDRTAPFFHNGAFPTLESVVDFYDKGGGRGLGLDVPNQDPDVRPLRLGAADKRALLRFLRVALADPKPSR